MSKSLPDDTELTLSSVLRDEGLRKRHVWHGDDPDSLRGTDSDDSDLLDGSDDDDDDDEYGEEEDAVGCPLPSTPEDHQLLEEEVITMIINYSSDSLNN